MIQIIIYAITFIAFIVFLIQAGKRQSTLGINLKRVKCPVCGTPQPMIRMPKNFGHAMYGGTTCPKCGINLDKYGNIIR